MEFLYLLISSNLLSITSLDNLGFGRLSEFEIIEVKLFTSKPSTIATLNFFS